MGNFKGSKITEIRIYDDPEHPDTSDFTVGLPNTLISAVSDGDTGISLDWTLTQLQTRADQTDLALIPAFAVCDTAGDARDKTADIPAFRLINGASAAIYFANANTAALPTLNISGSGAYPIYYRGAAIVPGILAAAATLKFTFDGAYWRYTGEANGNPYFEALGAAELIAGTNTEKRVVTAIDLNAAIQAIAQAKIDENGLGNMRDTITQLQGDVADLQSRVGVIEFLYDNSGGSVAEFGAGDLIIVANQGVLSNGKIVI